jgi:hypothetical protein
MDERAPRSGQRSVDVERLASLDRLNELLSDTTLTRDRLLAEMQDEINLLRCRAALAQTRSDHDLSRQLDLVANEVAYLASTF